MIYSYCRTSTFDQATSLTEQLKKNTVIAQFRCDSLALEFQNFSDEGVSGSLPLGERPAGAELMATVKKGDTIICAKLDRIFRSARDALVMADRFKEQGVDLILADLGTEAIAYDGVPKLIFGVLAQIADFERGRILERLREGRAAKKAKGGHIAGHAPYGFKVVGSGKEARLEECPEELEVLRLARKLHQQTGNAKAVSVTLGEMGYRSRAGSEFQSGQVLRMVRQERVSG